MRAEETPTALAEWVSLDQVCPRGQVRLPDGCDHSLSLRRIRKCGERRIHSENRLTGLGETAKGAESFTESPSDVLKRS
jgi:hypothetical protein